MELGGGRQGPGGADSRAMGREFPALSCGGIRLSRGSRCVFPGEPLACGSACGMRDERAKRQSWPGIFLPAWGCLRGSSRSDFERVVAVESAPAATAALKENLRGTNATAVKATTLDFLRGAAKGERPDVIVVDPPRAGTGSGDDGASGKNRRAQDGVCFVRPGNAGARLARVMAAGYAIEQITLADLFPQTFHLETVVAAWGGDGGQVVPGIPIPDRLDAKFTLETWAPCKAINAILRTARTA